ncbi:unnamed protein product [Bemisia tabaci]|uniref:Uncharacterized protein n=1 Tax=Bemisia tabaci TaxID=7038 RepID=A0A9P0F4D6_BEMTA|nr:unnamed protein product [Bemisia tabaci]
MVPVFVLAFAFIACGAGSEARGLNRVSLSPEQKLERNFVEFESFRNKYGRQYLSPTQALERFHVFAKNLEKIDTLNEMEQGTAEYGVNEMADWTQEEFLTRRANLDSAKLLKSVEKENYLTYSKEIKEIPNTKDWFEEGKVAPPKDQGQCGSCWAFSTVGAVESNDAIKNNSLTRRSEQQLVDCDTKSNQLFTPAVLHTKCTVVFLTQGCNGGWMDDAFKYLMNNSLRTEASYPYTGKDGSCKVQRGEDGDGGIKVTKIINMKPRDERALKQHIAVNGPSSNAVDATDMQFYKKGVMKPMFCSSMPRMLNHAVLGVGYGTDKRAGDYWIFKNSWGENWGEKGFFRLKMGSNACGIANVMQGVETDRERVA